MDTVIARTRPSHFALSKNTVSPTPTARTTEIASSHTARADMSVSPLSPSVAPIHATMKTLPTVERRALSDDRVERRGEAPHQQIDQRPGQGRARGAECPERRIREERHAGSARLRAPSGLPAISRLRPPRARLIAATSAGYVGAPVGSATVNRRSPRSRRSGPTMRQRASRTTIAAERAVEARHLDHHLVLDGARARPREERDALGRHQRGQVVGDGSRHAVGERLAPAVEVGDVDLLGAPARHDRGPIDVARQPHRPHADRDGATVGRRRDRPRERRQDVEARRARAARGTRSPRARSRPPGAPRSRRRRARIIAPPTFPGRTRRRPDAARDSW